MENLEVLWVVFAIFIGLVFGIVISLVISYAIYVSMVCKSNKLGDTKNTFQNYATHKMSYVAKKNHVSKEKYYEYLKMKQNTFK